MGLALGQEDLWRYQDQISEGLFFVRRYYAFAWSERVEEQPIITSPVRGRHMNFSQRRNTLPERLESRGEWLWGGAFGCGL